MAKTVEVKVTDCALVVCVLVFFLPLVVAVEVKAWLARRRISKERKAASQVLGE